MNRIIVESEAAFRHAADRVPEPRQWLTTAPWLLHGPARGSEMVLSLEQGLEQEEMDRLGLASLGFAQGMTRWLDEFSPRGFDLGEAMGMALHRAWFALSYKALLLDRALAGGDLQVVGDPKASRPDTLGFGFGRFDSLYAVLAGRMGGEGPRVLEYQGQAGGERRLEQMQSVGTSAFERFIYLLNADAAGLWFRFVGKVLGGVWPGLPGFPRLFLGKPCELMEDTAFKLALRGCRLEQVGTKLSVTVAGDPPPGFDAAAFASEAFDVLRHEFSGHRLAWSPAQEAAVSVMTDLVVDGLRHCSSAAAIADRAAQAMADRGCRAFLTNGLSTPLERFLFQALDRAGVTVIGFEHGLHEGLGTSSRYTWQGCSTLQSHYAVCLTKAALEHFRAMGGTVRGVAAGAFDSMKRIRLAGVQRRAVLRHLGLEGRRPVCVYVMTSNRNNMIYGPHGQNDMEQDTVTREVCGILCASSYDVVLKQYPTNRYLDPDPLALAFRDLEGVRVVQYEEFRYLRACADLVVLDSAQSVLSWAWAVGHPLVYLELPSDPLLPRARQAVEEAVFLVGCASPRWRERLRELAEMSPGQLRKQWRAKAAARARATEEFILGPRGSAGRRASSFVLNAVRQSRTNQNRLGLDDGGR